MNDAARDTTSAKVVDRATWLEKRKQLLEREKELTRAKDELNKSRQEMPLVKMDIDYKFTSPSGETVRLLDLFEGRKQLIVYHFMFSPDWEKGCNSCSFFIDNLPTQLGFLNLRDTTFAAVSRAPQEKIQPFKKHMDWSITWYSSSGGDFNYDFHVTLDETVRPINYNYTNKEEMQGKNTPQSGEAPGMSVFYREGDEVYHAYSMYARALDDLLITYKMLDITPLGRMDGFHVGKMPYHQELK